MDDLLGAFRRSLFPVQVLVVDDHLEARRALRRGLEHQGYSVVEAENGLEALTVLEQSHVAVDLLITDVEMPGMGGDEMVQRVRRGCPDLPVLLVSGEPAFAGLVEQIGGACRFLPKPFSVTELLDAVRQVLDGPDPSTDELLRPALELEP